MLRLACDARFSVDGKRFLLPFFYIVMWIFMFCLSRYLLEFDDDEEDGSLPQRSVPFHKVVPLPEGHRQ